MRYKEILEALSFNSKRQPLDFKALYGKAFRITDCAGDPSREGFSIITPFENKSAWDEWKQRPEFAKIVEKNFNDPHFLADHKYQQVVDAAKKLGLM